MQNPERRGIANEPDRRLTGSAAWVQRGNPQDIISSAFAATPRRFLACLPLRK